MMRTPKPLRIARLDEQNLVIARSQSWAVVQIFGTLLGACLVLVFTARASSGSDSWIPLDLAREVAHFIAREESKWWVGVVLIGSAWNMVYFARIALKGEHWHFDASHRRVNKNEKTVLSFDDALMVRIREVARGDESHHVLAVVSDAGKEIVVHKSGDVEMLRECANQIADILKVDVVTE